ncbi:MAG: MFS transporter [Sphingobacteriales bacterium]|nr:MAG: MFS transporter [Sphingobacteriales bacterium]
MNVVSIIRTTYGGIKREVWLLSLALLINRCGSMVLLFMSVYLTQKLGFSVAQAGVVMAMFGAGSLVGAFAGGRLVDTFNSYSVMIGSLLLSGVFLVLLGFMRDYWMIAGCTFMVTLTGDAFRPANTVALAHHTTGADYSRSVGLNRLAMNLGFTIGPAIGGFLAAINYQLLFFADGLTCAMSALFIYAYFNQRRYPRAAKVKNDMGKAGSPYQDRRYLFFIIIACLYAIAFFQMISIFPLYYKHDYLLNEEQIGWLMALNGVSVAIVEMFLITYIRNKWTQFNFMTVGICLLIAGYLMYIAFHGIWVLVAVMILFTMSEMLVMSFMATYSMARGQSKSLGEYMGLYSIAWSIALILSPVIGSQLIEHYGFVTLWLSMIGVSLLTIAGIRYLAAHPDASVTKDNH